MPSLDSKAIILAATLFCFIVAVLFKSGPSHKIEGLPSMLFQGAILLVLAAAAIWIFLHWSSLMHWI